MADISVEKKWVPSQFRIYCDLSDFQVRVGVRCKDGVISPTMAFSSSISVLQLYFAMGRRSITICIQVLLIESHSVGPNSQSSTQRPILTGEGQAIPVFHPHAHTHPHTCTHFVPLVSVTSRTRFGSLPRILSRPASEQDASWNSAHLWEISIRPLRRIILSMCVWARARQAWFRFNANDDDDDDQRVVN